MIPPSIDPEFRKKFPLSPEQIALIREEREKAERYWARVRAETAELMESFRNRFNIPATTK